MQFQKLFIHLFFIISVVPLIFCDKNKSIQTFNISYPGGTFPDSLPQIFAPSIISTAEHEHSYPSFSPDGKEVFWTVMFTTPNIEFPPMILYMKKYMEKWLEPQIADFSGQYPDGEGGLSPDGTKFFFASQRPIDKDGEIKKDLDIWFVEKTSTGWGNPQRLNSNINTDKYEMQPSVTSDGTLYYVGYYEKGKNNYGIYRSVLRNGEYDKPELLGENINSKEVDWTPFISPDESYLLFSSLREGGFGSGDIYISFKNEDGTFTNPVNLGPRINTKNNERFPYISPDKKILFYLSDKTEYSHNINDPFDYNQIKKIANNPGNGYCDIYWIDANIITVIKNNNLQ